MRQIKILFLLIVTILFSCEDLDINNNPNKVTKTHPSLLLTNIIVDAASNIKGRESMHASRMIVTTDSESLEQIYKWSREEFYLYNNLRQVTKMMEEATRISNNSYIAIGHFFRAYHFYTLALTFGDIPYSEALKGETKGVYQPKYDKQEDIFRGILKELAEANILLNKGDLMTSDPIFNGDTSKWKKLINSFRLKILLTLSKKTSNSSINIKNEFASIYNSQVIINTPEDSAKLEFLDVAGSRYTEFGSSTYSSNLYMASTFVDMLKDRNDPRLFAIAGKTKNAKQLGLAINDFTAYQGGDPIVPYNDVNLLAAAGKVSQVNKRYTEDPTAEAYNLLSYSEIQFILAEATLKGWITGSTEDFYKNAIKANFKFYNKYAKDYEVYYTEAEADTYLTGINVDFSLASSNEEKLELIITQKYLSSFLQGEYRMYFDHLRTGFPTFPYIGLNTPPTRWMYPLKEYDNNAKNVTTAISRQFGSSNDAIRELTWWLK